MSKSKSDKYANVLNSDAFLRASTINTRLSLLGRELNNNIENLVINEKTLGQVFNKQNMNKKTIYSSGKYNINFENLISDNVSCDNILIEQKQKDILYKGNDDEDQLKIIEEEAEQVNEAKDKKEVDNIFEQVEENVNKPKEEESKQNDETDSIFNQYLYNTDNTNMDNNNEKNKDNKNENNNDNNDNLYENVNDNNDNNNENNENKADIKDMRLSTMFQDIMDFNQEKKEDDVMKFLNEKKKEELNKKKERKGELHMSALFNNILSPEEEKEKEKEKEREKKKLEAKINNLNKNQKLNIIEENDEKDDEEEDKKKDVLKEEYFPIDVIEEAEKYYNLSNDSKEDLYPLNTYQMSHGLTIDFIYKNEIDIENKNSNNFSAVGLDELGNIYLCTDYGKIIKKKYKSKNKKEEIIISSSKYRENITCVDIFENIIITGDATGNIIVWIDDKINQALVNINGTKTAILCIKIIEVIPDTKVTLLFSDVEGDVYIVNFNPNKIGENQNKKILTYENMPVYNILIYPENKSEIKKEKQSIYIILASAQKAGLYILYLEAMELIELTVLEYIYGEKGKFQFDISIGYGFPPVADLKNKMGVDIAAASRGSISDTIALSDTEEENSMIAVSYGSVIQLFAVKIKEKKFKPIGYFINERPVLRMFFIFNSMIALLTDNFNLTLINTYDFIPKAYNTREEHTPTKNCFISYELVDINKYGIKGQEIDVTVQNKPLKKTIFTNTLIPTESALFAIGENMDKFYRFYLSNYADVLNDLLFKEEYVKILWLSLLIFNRKKNLLNNQINYVDKNFIKNNRDKLCENFLTMFLISKVIPELTKNNEIFVRMFLEFFMETNYFEKLPKFIMMLSSSDELHLDKYIFMNLTKYMVNGNLYDIVLSSNLLKDYISYYINQNDKLLLNKVLLKLNLDSLLQPEILKIILEKELINPYIYTRIKNIQAGKTDYFLPVLYLDTVFKKDTIKEKYELEKQNEKEIKKNLTKEQLELFEKQIEANKEEMEKAMKERKEIEKEYKKLIIEHNMDYFNEKTFSCHEYLGHKFLWYCNKCLSGKEYPNDTQMSPNNFKETSIKILAYLLIKENIKSYLEFDSYTYLKIIKKFYLEPKLFNLIHNEENASSTKGKFSSSVIEIIDKYLGNKRSECFNLDYIYASIRDVAVDCDVNKFYIDYDFYIMTCELCSNNNNLNFDKSAIMDTLLFFSDFYIEDFSNNSNNDPYNCHRKIESKKEIKRYYNKLEEYMLNLLNYLKERNNLEEEFVNTIVKKNKIKEQYKKVYFYLCEESRQYKECFRLKIDEYERNPDNYGDKNKKELFSWIERIIEYTYSLDILNEKVYHKEISNEDKEHTMFKKILLSYLKILCEISIDELSKITDVWFIEDYEQEDLIQHLGGGVSNALQLKYIDHFFLLKKKDMNDNIDKYIKFLEIEIDLLIKERNKKRIKELLVEYKILCNEHILDKLLKNSINDCCIYICQILGRVKDGVELTVKEVKRKYDNIQLVLEKPNYNPILIDIELNEIYKYFEMGLSVCQNNFFELQKEDKEIDDNWLQLFNTACKFKIDFYPKYEINKNNIKTKDHKKIFLSLQNCIQLILEKMSDYITLDLLVEIIANNCKNGKIIEFYTFLDKSFYAFRRTETILQSGKNLMSTSVLIQYDELGRVKTFGKHIFLMENKCDFCKFYLKSFNSYSFKLFECGHKYHVNCCAEENGEKCCYICTKEEIGDNEERAKNFKEGKLVLNLSDDEKQNQDKLKRQAEEKSRKQMNKTKLNLLKKIRKKQRELNAVLNGNIVYGMN